MNWTRSLTVAFLPAISQAETLDQPGCWLSLEPCRLPDGADLMQTIRSESLITIDSPVNDIHLQVNSTDSHVNEADSQLIVAHSQVKIGHSHVIEAHSHVIATHSHVKIVDSHVKIGILICAASFFSYLTKNLYTKGMIIG